MQIPPRWKDIYGATFTELFDFEKLNEKIAQLAQEIKDGKRRKPKVLFVGEASFLKTGFSTYWDAVLRRLHKWGNINIVELGSYAAPTDPRIKNVPWKFYAVMPDPNDPEDVREYGNPHGSPDEQRRYHLNQFGKHKFDPVVAAEKPDIVCTLRDHWMDSYISESVFRDRFHWIWLLCIDSQPQQWEWLKTFNGVDTCLAYSHFGKRVAEVQSRHPIAQSLGIKPINVELVIQPAIDTNIYHPMDKALVKQRFNIPPQVQFVGMVARNQKRKLFPRLIEAFRIFKKRNGWGSTNKKIKNIDNIKLLLHTSIRDVGFNIPEAIRREGLQNEVYFTYICRRCGVFGVTPFIGSPARCPNCGHMSFDSPNTQVGLPDDQFNLIFNLMDVYVQMSIAGAAEMPIVNAKACGVPVIVSGYAAMYEQGLNGGGMIVKGDLETEAETMQRRFWFNREDLVEKLTKLFRKPNLLKKLGKEARECAVKYYNWDLAAKKWEYILLSRNLKPLSETWQKPIKTYIIPSNPIYKENLSNEEFITQCYQKILNREPDPEGYSHWLNQLSRGRPREDIEKFFRRIAERNNRAAELLEKGKLNVLSPIEKIKREFDPADKFRILYCMPQTAGDVLISTAIVRKLKEKYPNASIYFATEKRYFDILKGNPDIKKVIEYKDFMLNYRIPEPFGPQKGFVDLCFCPFIVTQRIPHWIHGGKGESLGVTYAHLCNLTMTDEEISQKMYIALEKPNVELPETYITFHAKTTQDPKDYERWDEVFEQLQGITVVQVGNADEPLIKYENVIDLRGKTTPQQLAYIIKHAKLHLGLDSFPAHVASAVETPSVILYGGTYAKQGGIQHNIAIEPKDRNGCVTSCHLIECIQKKQGRDKCINNIEPDEVIEALKKILNVQYFKPPKELKVSAYCIIKDGIKYGFPFEECIRAALKIVDEFVMVDGGSTDGTWERLQELQKEEPRLKIYQHEWDMDDPMLMGNEKTYAKEKCTGDYVIQLDADEILVEPHPGAIKKLIRRNKKVVCFDLPVINLYDNEKIRLDDTLIKWRIYKNTDDWVHTAPGQFREFDPDTMKITFDKKKCDSCEPCNRYTLEIIPHVSVLPPNVLSAHYALKEAVKKGNVPDDLLKTYCDILRNIVKHVPHVVHYSWNNLETKKKRGEFWSNTYHGRKSWTHNTTQDIEERIKENKEFILPIALSGLRKEENNGLSR